MGLENNQSQYPHLLLPHPNMRYTIVIIAAICYLTVSLASVSEFSDEETIPEYGETLLVENTAEVSKKDASEAAHLHLQRQLAKARRVLPHRAQQRAWRAVHPVPKAR